MLKKNQKTNLCNLFILGKTLRKMVKKIPLESLSPLNLIRLIAHNILFSRKKRAPSISRDKRTKCHFIRQLIIWKRKISKWILRNIIRYLNSPKSVGACSDPPALKIWHPINLFIQVRATLLYIPMDGDRNSDLPIISKIKKKRDSWSFLSIQRKNMNKILNSLKTIEPKQ